MSIKTFDLVGTIHGREYSDHGEFVTADDYYHLQLYSEAVDRLKLGMEQDLEKLKEDLREAKDAKLGLSWAIGEIKAENKSLRKDAERWRFVRNPIGNGSPFAIWNEGKRVFLGCFADEAIDAAISSSENPS